MSASWTLGAAASRSRPVSSAALGVRATELSEYLRLEYAKVAEFQARGPVDFHALVRIDGPDGQGSPAPIPAAVLTDVLREAATAVHYTADPGDGDDVVRLLRFGAQTDVRVVRQGAIVGEDVTAEQVAAYLAKYSTKSAGVDLTKPRPHLAAPTQACQDLANRAMAGCPLGCAERATDRHPCARTSTRGSVTSCSAS